jgi:hypothetical protein
MRNMSFALTVGAMENKTKTVTRRLGWAFLKPGDLVWAVDKSLGLKKGEMPRRLSLIRIADIRREPLDKLIDFPKYGEEELIKEGIDLTLWTPVTFVAWFCNQCKVGPSEVITRIEFEHLDKPEEVL